MRRVELAAGIQSSVLGFGCAPILGSVGEDVAERAIRTALEKGINHFDLARSYGYGRAEAAVGRVLRGRRDEVVLATKFGIEATLAARLLSPLKPLIRALRPRKAPAHVSAGSQNISPAPAANRLASLLHRRVPFDPATMIRSLEASLRALRTDRVEFLFLHAPEESIGKMDELAATATRLKQQGKIRAWGLASYCESWLLHSSYLQMFDVLQFNCSPGTPNYEGLVTEMGTRANVLFSPFQGSRQATERLSPDVILGRLMRDFPKSVILCSMFNENHIRNNVAVAAV